MQENNITDNLCNDVFNHVTDLSGHFHKFLMNTFDAFCFFSFLSVLNLDGGCDDNNVRFLMIEILPFT